MPDLTGRVALVTGASTGIGRAIAVELARSGARIVINYPFESERDNAEETRRMVRDAAASGGAPSGEPSILVRADVTNEDEIKAMFEAAITAFGTPNVLVNNAGIQIEEPASHQTTTEHFDAVLDVNLRGSFICAREFIAGALDASGGVILNVSSVHQKIPRPHYLSYAVSKYGIQAITETLALEYADRGIRVVAIAPGATRTPIQSWLGDEDMTEVVASHIPMKRIAEPEEMGRMAAFLVSDDAKYVTGQTLYADGGLTLYADFQEPWSG